MNNHDSHTDYWRTVQAIADECYKEHGDNYDEASDYISQSVDGSYWVIYTHAAKRVLEYSDNDCAYFDAVGAGEWSDLSTMFSQLAFFAMEMDVREAYAEVVEEKEEDGAA